MKTALFQSCGHCWVFQICWHIECSIWIRMASQVALRVKNLPASVGGARDDISIPGSGKSSGRGMATHSSIFAWRIPWTDGLGRVESMGLQRIGHDWVINTFTSLSVFIKYVHLHQKTTKEKELVSIFIYQNSESCLSKINDYIERFFFEVHISPLFLL